MATDLRAAIEAATTPAELEGLAAEASARRTATGEKLALAARRRAAALKAVATRRGRETLSLVPFLCRAGGLQDQGGEVSAVTGTKRHRLVQLRGMTLDGAALLAQGAGYFPEHATTQRSHGAATSRYLAGRDAETMTPAALLDAIDAELRGAKRWPGHHQPEAETDADREAADEAAAEREAAANWRAIAALARDGGWQQAWPFLAERAGITVTADEVTF